MLTTKEIQQQSFPQVEKKPTMEDLLRNDATIKNLETQIGQLASMMQEQESETLPSTNTTNSKEHANAISL